MLLSGLSPSLVSACFSQPTPAWHLHIVKPLGSLLWNSPVLGPLIWETALPHVPLLYTYHTSSFYLDVWKLCWNGSLAHHSLPSNWRPDMDQTQIWNSDWTLIWSAFLGSKWVFNFFSIILAKHFLKTKGSHIKIHISGHFGNDLLDILNIQQHEFMSPKLWTHASHLHWYYPLNIAWFLYLSTSLTIH